MSKKLIVLIVSLVVLCAIGGGAFFLIKNISDENHKKDIEMAADCAKTFEVAYAEATWDASRGGFVSNGAAETTKHNRLAKRQECSEKYHVTHQEIIDKIGTSEYFPE